jgi:apolipoprotein N-acyltransferase
VPRGLALVAGALPLVAFPEPGLWWFAWIALVPWLLLMRAAPSPREAGVRSWCAGIGFLLATHWWLVSYLSLFAVPLFAAFGLLWLPWGRIAWRVLSARPGPGRAGAALIVVPSGWVVIELVRSWEHLGGTWAALGASQWNQPATLATAALGGAWLVSWLVVATNVAVVLVATGAMITSRVIALLGAAAAVASGPVYHVARAEPAEQGTARIALVQSGLGDHRDERLDQAVAVTRRLPRRDVDLAVWGESSVKFDLERRPDVVDRLRDLAREVDAPLLVNLDARRHDDRISKSAVLVTSGGTAGRYDKSRLVPFGEYVPLRFLFGWVPGLTEAADEDRRRGDDVEVLRAEGIVVGPLISFELGFPDLGRALARRGADIVIVQSMTSSFQGTWAPEQHASRATVRAVEIGRPVVHVGLTGVSAAFDTRGDRLAWMGTARRGATVITVPLATERTLYDRWGDWVAWASVAIALVTVGAMLLVSSGDRGGRLRSRE